MTLLETFALLTFILTLLGLIVDVIRLAVEVMTMFSKTDHPATNSCGQSFLD